MNKHVVKIKSINNETENNNFIQFSDSTQQQRFQGLLVPVSHSVRWLDQSRTTPQCCDPDACAHKTTATAIFKPVSHAWQPRAGLQWRKADQPTEMA